MNIKDMAIILARCPVGSTCFALLCIASAEGGSSMTAAARAIGVSTASITGSTDRLVHLGLAYRRYSETDRRVIMLHCTDTGLELIKVYQEKLDALVEGGAA